MAFCGCLHHIAPPLQHFKAEATQACIWATLVLRQKQSGAVLGHLPAFDPTSPRIHLGFVTAAAYNGQAQLIDSVHPGGAETFAYASALHEHVVALTDSFISVGDDIHRPGIRPNEASTASTCLPAWEP